MHSVYRLKAIKNPAPATADKLMAASVLAPLVAAASGVAAGVVTGTTAVTQSLLQSGFWKMQHIVGKSYAHTA